MSRIGKMPITVPAGVEVTIADGNVVTVKGPKGTLTSKFHHDMIIKQEGAVLTVSRPDDEHAHKSLHGLTRTLLHNMIVGVEKGFLLHSPLVEKIEIVRRGKVRRNNLRFLRERSGKSARLISKDFDRQAANTLPEVEEEATEAPAEEKAEA